MKTVKIIKSIHIAATGVTYKRGQEVEVSDELAARHEKRGFMRIVKPEAKASKPKTEKAAASTSDEIVEKSK
jgi:ribosomal 50S subunit-recycling heat shock protein